MRNKTVSYGNNARQIWEVLQDGKKTDERELQMKTKMSKEQFHGAIGWLARENKIRKEQNQFLLSSETNLTEEVGSLAGRVWKILDIWNEADIPTIEKLADADNTDIYTALGWLAREDKIEMNDNNNYCLKSTP